MRHKGKRIYIRNDRHDALACKNGAAYMYTATFTCRCEKKCVYDERGDKRCFFFLRLLFVSTERSGIDFHFLLQTWSSPSVRRLFDLERPPSDVSGSGGFRRKTTRPTRRRRGSTRRVTRRFSSIASPRARGPGTTAAAVAAAADTQGLKRVGLLLFSLLSYRTCLFLYSTVYGFFFHRP